MRFPIRTGSAWLGILFAVTVGLLIVACKSSLQPFAASCKADDEISMKDREVIDEVALKFVQDALGPDPSSAYVAFTVDALK